MPKSKVALQRDEGHNKEISQLEVMSGCKVTSTPEVISHLKYHLARNDVGNGCMIYRYWKLC